MAVRISNSAVISFGTFTTSAIVTHVRARRASDDGQPIVKALDSPIAVGANREFRFEIGDLEFRYLAGDFTNAHMRAVAEGYWGSGASLSMEIDAMSDATTVISVGGYSQATVSGWTLVTEAD